MKILVLIHSPFAMWTIPDAHVARLAAQFPQHTFLHARDDREGAALIADADVAFSAQITPEQFAAASRLTWVHSPAAGIAGMLHPAMVTSQVRVTNSRGISAETIAEHVLAVTLALFRRLPLAFRRQDERRWAQNEIASPPGNRTIAGSTAVIVGLGSIGYATARRLHALGARVIGVRRRVGDTPPELDALYPSSDLHRALAEGDVVVIAAPQTRETRGLIGEAELAAMKDGAVLVNVSRGGLIDETALAAALHSGRLAGAALDVFRDEPLDVTSPMWDLPNLLVTPHTSGFRRDHWDVVTELFAENLRRFERGDELINVVDKLAGY